MSKEQGASFRCLRAHVSGRVQGVGFRMATRAQARRLGLRGYAANLEDGRVEVVAYGDDRAIDDLLEWLTEGPPAARVDDVTESTLDPGAGNVPRGFEIR